MPYLIISDRSGELDRRELREPLIIGRALDCDVCIRDIELSRKHCKIEPFHSRWVVTDLGSKNGTIIGGQKVTRHVLIDGEVIRVGRSQICYMNGPFVPAVWSVPRREARPSNPIEASAGTVYGFQVFDMEEDSRISGFPIPKPRPKDPASYRQGDAGAMVTQMTSSAWDVMLSDPDAKHIPTQAPPEIAERQREMRQAKPPAPAEPLSAPQPRVLDPNQRPHPAPWLAMAYLIVTAAIVLVSAGIILIRSIF